MCQRLPVRVVLIIMAPFGGTLTVGQELSPSCGNPPNANDNRVTVPRSEERMSEQLSAEGLACAKQSMHNRKDQMDISKGCPG